MTTLFIIAFMVPLLLSLLFTPVVIKFAIKIGAIDSPGERKVHSSIMPRIGGLSVVLSVVATITIVFAFFSNSLPSLFLDSYTTLIVISCFVILFGLGFWDDLKPLSPEVKFGVQLILAAIIYFAGFKISNITNQLDTVLFTFGFLDLPITILWIVGITNAFNLIDGLDGLAAGVAVIACMAIFVIATLSGQIWTAIFALIIAGALVGFLRYNFNPAKIFLGDSGSLIIGFALAILSIQSTAKLSTGFAVMLPVLVLALPITDTLVSMIRRLIGSFINKEPNKSPPSLRHRLHGMFTPDRLHIHHRLLSLGLSHRNTVLVLYVVSLFFAFSAFIFTQIDSIQSSLTIAFSLGLILLLSIKKLRYYEISIFTNGLLMSYYEKWFLQRSNWISIADVLFIVVSFIFSSALIYLVNPVTIEKLNVGLTLAIVVPLQLITLWTTGLYREKMHHLGVATVIHIIASISMAVSLTGIVFLLMEFLPLVETIQLFIFDFYFLLSLLFGQRIAYQALSFLYNRDKPNGNNILIYGAGENGIMLLQNILTSAKKDLKVIGFLDDDPNLKGKLIYGYPILGNHWVLSKTHQNHKIDSIYLCVDEVRCENLRRLRNIAFREGMSIKKLNVTLQDVENTTYLDEDPKLIAAQDSVSSM